METTPMLGDSENTLLFKVCLKFSQNAGGLNPPRLVDSDNQLLFKIALTLAGLG